MSEDEAAERFRSDLLLRAAREKAREAAEASARCARRDRIPAPLRHETEYDLAAIEPAEPARGRSGRPRGSVAIPDADYLLREYRRVKSEQGGRPLTQEVFASKVRNAQDGAGDVDVRTLRTALRRYRMEWPPE